MLAPYRKSLFVSIAVLFATLFISLDVEAARPFGATREAYLGIPFGTSYEDMAAMSKELKNQNMITNLDAKGNFTISESLKANGKEYSTSNTIKPYYNDDKLYMIQVDVAIPKDLSASEQMAIIKVIREQQEKAWGKLTTVVGDIMSWKDGQYQLTFVKHDEASYTFTIRDNSIKSWLENKRNDAKRFDGMKHDDIKAKVLASHETTDFTLVTMIPMGTSKSTYNASLDYLATTNDYTTATMPATIKLSFDEKDKQPASFSLLPSFSADDKLVQLGFALEVQPGEDKTDITNRTVAYLTKKYGAPFHETNSKGFLLSYWYDGDLEIWYVDSPTITAFTYKRIKG